MKKIVSIVVVLMLCMSLAGVVYAAEGSFTPSVSYKDGPEVVPVNDPEGGEAIAVVKDKDGNIISYVHADCLKITPVAKAETSTEIPEDARQLLLSVYAQLLNDTMQLPYEKIDKDLEAQYVVIRDLFDATFVCEEHPQMLAEEGVVLEITFNLNLKANVEVYTMTYNEGEWNPIVSSVNNGDGTLTCTFEHLCPVSFSVETDRGPSDTGDAGTQSVLPWVILLVASGVALVGVVALRRKQVR